MKGIYKGPSHYWHQYSLVPREQYYYGYYGMYGPDTDLSMYKPIESPSNSNIENFCGSNMSSWVLYVLLAMLVLRLLK